MCGTTPILHLRNENLEMLLSQYGEIMDTSIIFQDTYRGRLMCYVLFFQVFSPANLMDVLIKLIGNGIKENKSTG